MTAENQGKLVPAPVPEELFDLGYTVSTAGKVEQAVYTCRMDGSYVPDQCREIHRRWHQGLARLIRDAGASS